MARTLAFRTRPGMTLTDLLIGLSLIGLLAGFTLGIVRPWWTRQRSAEVLQVLATDILYSQAEALRRGRSVGLVSEASRTAYRVCIDGDKDGLSRSDIQTGRDPCIRSSVPLERRPWMTVSDLRWGAGSMIVCGTWGLCTSATTCWRVPSLRERWCLVWNGTTGQLRWERSRDRGSPESSLLK